MTDPIADMLTRIRNALLVRKTEVILPYSKMKLEIAEILKKEGYITEVEKIKKSQNKNFEELKVILRYLGLKNSAISNLERISKPSRRIYVTKNKLPVVLNGLGIAIISTSQGLMTNKEARKRKLGGEIICEVY